MLQHRVKEFITSKPKERKKTPRKKDDADSGRKLVVFDSPLAALDHNRTTLCCKRCSKTVQNSLYVCEAHIVDKKRERTKKHYCPFLKNAQKQLRDDDITVPRWDTPQPLFPKKEKCEGKKRGGDESEKASAKKKQKKLTKMHGDKVVITNF